MPSADAENIVDKVKIISVEHHGPRSIGKVVLPTDYEVSVEYNGEKYIIDSKTIYSYAENRIGKYMDANIILDKSIANPLP